MKRIILISAAFFCFVACYSSIHAQQILAGKLKILDDFQTGLGFQQNVYVWTPNGYDGKTPCQVIYMFDGQMLFDGASTWNHLEWTMDETIDDLMTQKIIGPTIVIGLSFTDSLRHSQYTPEKPFRMMTEAQQQAAFKSKRANGQAYYLKQRVCSDDYLTFIVQTLKPFIDVHYNTYTDATHTYVGGASMGGLMAMYSLLEYPHIFGKAFCMSTNWPLTEAAQDPGFMKVWETYVISRLPSLGAHFIYMDYGGMGKDASYAPYQKSMDLCLRKNGFNQFETIFFADHDHSESSWAKRIKEVIIRIFLQ